MDLASVVRSVAKSMQLIDESGKLKRLTSIQVLDFVLELEQAAQVEIPTVAMRNDVFESVESIVEMLEDLAEK